MKKITLFSIGFLLILIILVIIRIFPVDKMGKPPEDRIYPPEVQKNLQKLKEIQKQAKIDALKPKIPKTFENVEPYTEPLPPVPDKKFNDSTLFGIDYNNNGVRDDLEHWIVKKFGKDKMVVESFFAYVRSDALDFKIIQDDLFTDELYENDISERTSIANGCRYKYFHLSQFLTYDTELYIVSRKFEKLMNNTRMRKKNAKHFSFNLIGKIYSPRIKITDKECKDFFTETESYKY